MNLPNMDLYHMAAWGTLEICVVLRVTYPLSGRVKVLVCVVLRFTYPLSGCIKVPPLIISLVALF